MSAALRQTGPEPRPVPHGARRPLADIVADLGCTSDWNWAWASYKRTVEAISREYGLVRHLEVGGGRDPLFTPAETRALGLSVTLNDISAGELSRAPDEFDKLLCDMAAPEAARRIRPGSFDFCYSRMVMEHVRDARQLWANQFEALAEGGVALAFMPTLYAPAFALNRLVPERLSSAIVSRLFPDRNDEGDNPKFPALYDRCYGDGRRMEPWIREIGFREVLVLPFYGYSYFWKVPGLKQIDRAFTEVCARRDWRVFTSFAYVIAAK